MKNPQNLGSSPDQTNSTSPGSSLVTWPGGIPPLLPQSEQKNLPPNQPQVPTSPRPPTSLPSGSARRWEIRYGELKLEQKLGQGAFGEVFSGSYRKSKVAVKLYDFRGKLPTEQEVMLLQEADVMEGLRSEYLVGFRGICLDPRYCLVMEFCEGGTLRARLDKVSEAIVPLEQLRWAMQISYGLYQLHAVKIVHRDLKGENILLDRQGHAKVADFGLSIVKSNSASHSKKGSSHGGAGTLPWMAPELHEEQSNSRETDVYSLGVALWEIVSRKMPYAGLGAGQMISRTVQGKRDPLPNPCPEVFRLMITACCQMEAKQRPTAEQVGDEFAAAIKSVDSVPPSVVGSGDEEMKKLLEKVKQLELEKAQEEKRRLLLEKKWEDHARQQAELERRCAEELKEIQRQPESSPSPKTPPKKEPESKKLTTPSLSGSSQILIPKPVIPGPAIKSRDDRGIQPLDEKSLSQLRQLLQYVAEGEQDQAEELIQKDKNLLLHAGTVTDLSSREFKPITAFQYALWAMDWYMWTMIQKYLPQEAQAQQCQELETKGTAYGKHFSLQGLTRELQTYVDNAKKWNYDQRATDQWCKKVGGEQKLLPVHVVNEYCRADRPFQPCPSEWESKLPRTREVPEMWTSTQSRSVKGSWFIASSSKDGLGLTYAFLRYVYGFDGVGGVLSGPPRRLPSGEAGASAHGVPYVVANLKALQSLWKTRTQQLETLQSKLLSTNQHIENMPLRDEINLNDQKLNQDTSVLSPKTATPSLELKKSTSSKTELITPASQNLYSLTAPKPADKPPVDQKALSQLLQYVAEGEQDKAEALIQTDKNLLLHAGTVKDLSGREFKPITAFQYALWAMDYHMWTMIKKYLPPEAQSQQFTALESKGTAHGKHFSLQPLTGALRTYVDKFYSWDWNQRSQHWQKVVGGEQKLLVTQVVNEYCRGDRPFKPCPQEWESKLPRTRELDVYDSIQSKWVKGTWFVAPTSKDGLGLNFAFYRAARGELHSVTRGWCVGGVRVGLDAVEGDLQALQSLWKTRTTQLELLKSQLSSTTSYNQTFGS